MHHANTRHGISSNFAWQRTPLCDMKTVLNKEQFPLRELPTVPALHHGQYRGTAAWSLVLGTHVGVLGGARRQGDTLTCQHLSGRAVVQEERLVRALSAA
jgi:hypothetical protein